MPEQAVQYCSPLLRKHVAETGATADRAFLEYSGCQVDCKYCAPTPLPYTHYSGCMCHSCAVSKHLHVLAEQQD